MSIIYQRHFLLVTIPSVTELCCVKFGMKYQAGSHPPLLWPYRAINLSKLCSEYFVYNKMLFSYYVVAFENTTDILRITTFW